jgi:hypothetical protein
MILKQVSLQRRNNMSGGHFDYMQYRVGEMFQNQFEDTEVNELFHDLFVTEDDYEGNLKYSLVDVLDMYLAGDWDEQTYKEALKEFKDKWLKRDGDDRKEYYQQKLQEYCDKLKKEW